MKGVSDTLSAAKLTDETGECRRVLLDVGPLSGAPSRGRWPQRLCGQFIALWLGLPNLHSHALLSDARMLHVWRNPLEHGSGHPFLPL